MKRLDKFVIKSFVGPLILTFFIVLIILLLQFLWMYIDELAGKGLEFKILAELIYQFTLSFVPTAMPLAILLAALMTFGNMGEFSELTALKSSGIPLMRIMRPLMVMIVVLVGVSFFFSNYVLPYSNRQARVLLYNIRRKRPDINLQAGSFNNDVDGFSIKITSKDPATNRLDNLIIYDHRDRKGNINITHADSGYIKVTTDETALIMTLYNGYSFTELEEKAIVPEERRYPSRRDTFEMQTIVIPLSGFDLERSGNELFRSSSWMMNMEQLEETIDSLTQYYTTRQNTNFDEFNTTKLYSQKYWMIGREKYTNTTNTPINRLFEANSLLDSISPTDKKNAVMKAIENVRDANNFLTEKTEMMLGNIRAMKKYVIDWHKKLTLPFACLVFFFIGAPLGAIIRKGGLGTPAVISIFFFVIWYVISISCEKLVEEDLISGLIGMWASSYILLPVGLFLTYKASNDSVIMNVDTYTAFLKKIKDFIYRITIQGKTKNPDNITVEDE